MKKVLMCIALAIASLNADAALFVINNTTCDLSLDVYGNDGNLAMLFYIWFKVPAGAFLAYYLDHSGWHNVLVEIDP